MVGYATNLPATAIPVMPIIQTVGGIGEFINGIRSAFGRSGEFAAQNGFDYNNVYNSLLQYTVANAYMEKQNHGLLLTQIEETAAFREEANSYNFRGLLIQTTFLALWLLTALVNLIMNIIRACRPRTRRFDTEDE